MSSNTKNNQIILRNRSHNKRYKVAFKKAIKKYLLSLKTDTISLQSHAKNMSNPSQNLSIVYQKIDKAVKRKVLHRNTAARKKARLASMLK